MDAAKNILFVSANMFCEPYPVYPLGVSYLKTYIENRDPSLNISVFDFNCATIEDFITVLHTGHFSFICVSLRNIDDTNIYAQNCFIGWYKQIINTARANSDATIVIGGAGFSIFPQEIFNDLQPDYGITGEGEETLYRVITAADTTFEKDLEGLVYKSSNEVIINSRKNNIPSIELKFEESLIDFYWKKSGMLNIQTKRGCPYNCIYCSYPIIDGRKVRTFDPERIVRVLSDVKEKHGIDYVFFTDSIFNIHNDYNVELANLIIKSNIRVRWGAYFSHSGFDRDHLELFKAAGLTHIEFGTDSISDTQLKNYHKSFTVDQIMKNSRTCNELGVYFAHFLILGGYGETDATLEETFRNSELIDNTVFFPYVGMRIYPGTVLFDKAVSEGRIKERKELLNPVYYISEDISVEKIRERAALTGKRWIFPDFDNSAVVNRLRERNKKGPLWEYLRQ